MRRADPAPDVEHLLALDPDVPGLRILLDDEALQAWVDAHLPAPAPRVRRSYLRWKPGAGGIARVRLDGGAGPGGPAGPGGTEALLLVGRAEGAAKLAKVVQRAPASVLVADAERLAVLALPAADRHLPGLGRLLQDLPHALGRLTPTGPAGRRALRRATSPALLATLAWKPQRRWVGLVHPGPGGRGAPFVLRAYRASEAAGVLARYRAVHRAASEVVAVPRPLGVDPRRGVVAVEHLPGITLDRSAGASPDVLREVGRAVAGLHGAGGTGPRGVGLVGGLRVLGREDECAAVLAAARTVERLRPGSGAGSLATQLVSALRALPATPDVLLHGDLSEDQVVLGPDGRVGLIDLDEVTPGPASYDLAGAAATWWLSDPGAAPARVAALLTGYGEVRQAPADAALRVRTAAHVLRRAPEPFRTASPSWPHDVAHAVATAAHVLGGPRATPSGRPAGVAA